MPAATETAASLSRSAVTWLRTRSKAHAVPTELPWQQALACLARLGAQKADPIDNQQRMACLQQDHPQPAGLWTGNSPIHLALLQLSRQAGIGLVPIPLATPARTLEGMCRQANLAALFCDHDRLKLWQEMTHKGFRLPPAIVVDTPTIAQEAVSATWLENQLQHRAPAPRLLFTSGTDGTPKAVLRPSASDHYRIQQFVERFALHKGIPHIVAGPLYHSGPAIFAATSMALHAPITVLETFDPARLAQLVLAGPPPSLFLVPTQLAQIESTLGPNGFARFLQSLARLWVAGARFDPAFKQRVATMTRPDSLYEFYGATETGTITILQRDEMLKKPASVGKPAAGISVRILDAEGNACPNGATGYLFVKSPMTISAYLDPAEPLRSQDGYICIGDLGSVDADGYLYLQGRDNEMMISGGVNVYPAEVEDGLAQIQGVQSSLAFARPDPVWGDRIEALVVPIGNTLTPRDVLEEVRQVLPPASRPRQIHFVEALPLGSTGKPDRKLAGKLTANLI